MAKETPRVPSTARAPEFGDYAAQDEISLFDLWGVLVRRKWTILVVTAVVLALAVFHAFSRTESYRYSMAIEIGTIVQDGDSRTIESAQAVVAKLEENYLASAISDYLREQDNARWQPNINVEMPEDSGIVILSAEGPQQRQDAYETIMRSALQRLVADHGRLLEATRADLELQVSEAQNKVANARDVLDHLKGELARIDQRGEILRAEIDSQSELLNAAETQRRQAAESLGSESQAMTLLMLNNELRELRARIAELRIHRNVDLEARRSELEAEITAQQRRIEEHSGQVDVLRVRQENMSLTRPLSDVQRSLQPTGPGDSLILALGGILGLMLGVFAAFGREFVTQANRHLREVEDTDSIEGEQS